MCACLHHALSVVVCLSTVDVDFTIRCFAPYDATAQLADYNTILALMQDNPDGFIVGRNTFASSFVYGASQCLCYIDIN